MSPDTPISNLTHTHELDPYTHIPSQPDPNQPTPAAPTSDRPDNKVVLQARWESFALANLAADVRMEASSEAEPAQDPVVPGHDPMVVATVEEKRPYCCVAGMRSDGSSSTIASLLQCVAYCGLRLQTPNQSANVSLPVATLDALLTDLTAAEGARVCDGRVALQAWANVSLQVHSLKGK